MKKKTESCFGDEHLMVDETMLDKICGYASLSETDVVLEVGAGTGNLTKVIAKEAGRVYAIEKNEELFQELESNLKDYKNVDRIWGDATKLKFPECNKVVSNLPYSISRKITKKFLLHGFDLAVLVYQKEFAQKLLADVGSDHYRMITVLVQSSCEVEVLGDISPEAFQPQPNVWSSIVRLKMKRKPTEEYAELLNDLFNHKNKKIRNIRKDAPEEYAARIPCEIPAEEFINLYEKYYNKR